jgi:hypothetical protein
MSDVEVTPDAGNIFAAMNSKNGVRQLHVAALARALCNVMVVTLDLNIVGKAARRKRKRVEEPVGGLNRVLAR